MTTERKRATCVQNILRRLYGLIMRGPLSRVHIYFWMRYNRWRRLITGQKCIVSNACKRLLIDAIIASSHSCHCRHSVPARWSRLPGSRRLRSHVVEVMAVRPPILLSRRHSLWNTKHRKYDFVFPVGWFGGWAKSFSFNDGATGVEYNVMIIFIFTYC